MSLFDGQLIEPGSAPPALTCRRVRYTAKCTSHAVFPPPPTPNTTRLDIGTHRARPWARLHFDDLGLVEVETHGFELGTTADEARAAMLAAAGEELAEARARTVQIERAIAALAGWGARP